ncbi:MAG: peptide MFS transporter [Elusimicrobia bacterium]|nr:peptide MFS transporter [Elusimicrobiota bacterium]
MTSKAKKPGEWFGHPKGLYVLFFTEMWERFSYYGMRALLVLYMTKRLILDANAGAPIVGFEATRAFVQWFVGLFGMHETLTVQALSSQIYGLYTGFVFFTPFFGGILADRVFGQRKSVYIGGVLMAIGHFLMAFENLFLPALLFLILGNGCFKPNISTQVGNLYAEGDQRRDSAFTIFYMGINLGAFFSPLVCGTLGQMIGWDWGFGAAGVGMIVGLAVYHFGKHLLPPDRIQKTGMAREHLAEKKVTAQEWKAIWALVFLCVVNIVFWAVYEQQGNTLQLWADANTRWQFFGYTVPSSWYQSFNPLFIFIFAPFMDKFWGWQAKRGQEPSSVTKMGIGCVLLGGAFIIMIAASRLVGPTEKGSLLWLVSTTWLFTMGELYLSPIGLSLVTKMAPARMVSMLMGMWFLSSFFGNYLSGFIGGFYGTMSKEVFFTMLMAMGVGAGLIFFAANKPLHRSIGHGV